MKIAPGLEGAVLAVDMGQPAPKRKGRPVPGRVRPTPDGHQHNTGKPQGPAHAYQPPPPPPPPPPPEEPPPPEPDDEPGGVAADAIEPPSDEPRLLANRPGEDQPR